jgi:(1->4)-alpha-D-glucan 1-alpha-D-glucosylmutase
MLGTSTHDSKRGEDLRARIDVLSEDLTLWHTHLERMTGLAQMFERDTPAGKAPTRNDVWLLFQTLAGLWPAEPPDEAALADLRERVQAYMLKAVREAKLSTSWTWPNEEYEAALAHYIASVLRSGANPFADELQRLTAVIAPFGFRNSLSQLALKLTVPGVPDIYQGCEQWNFSLVDPDNRRPVDFAHLARELDEVKRLYEGESWATPAQWTALCTSAAMAASSCWPHGGCCNCGRACPSCSATDAACITCREHALAMERVIHGERSGADITAPLIGQSSTSAKVLRNTPPTAGN